MGKPWYMFDITVPFGDTHFDTGYYASHDLDVGAPPNYPVTNLLVGTIVSITRPSWGWQVGIRLDRPYNGIPFCHFLHLSAVNPHLTLNSRVNVGDLVGWVGGANNESQYVGTTNPTGENYTNPLSQSSQIQVGFAISHGEEYGVGAGWENWILTHQVDWSLNPTPIIKAAQEAYMNQQQSTGFMEQAAHDTWNATGLNLPETTGIARSWHDRYAQGHVMPPPTTKEWKSVKWDGTPIAVQQFGPLRCEWPVETGGASWYKADGGF